ncbi:HD domain-containing protein [Baekduia soli]|uniref:HD domain-containing protein n=1 Tax=Baekduia soli TaxID=496014 RepID=A0A5B8U115_9ACTN|nr:HD domain-containing phosphohydrolase [Baekduia soli]QEC46630.1 HD domain-containing protein [Baekduia soli]
MTGQDPAQRPRLVATIAASALALSAAVAVADPGSLADPLWIVLLGCAIASRFVTTDVSSRMIVSGMFLSGALAAGLVGPAAAFVIPVATELAGWTVDRYRRSVLPLNLASSALPTVAVAAALQALDLDHDRVGFFLAVALGSFVILAGNFLMMSAEMALLDGHRLAPALRPPLELLGTAAVNIALVTAAAAVYEQTGYAVLVFVLVAVVAFGYMARLVMLARDRAREYANLSWGVLSGLIRTLDARDQRAARHCAAVARFARDIAAHVGMSERDQELAHTAGLLHDIGRFALSDRVMERGVVLTEDDWVAIRRHPELGADLLRDIGVYGPLSEIIVAHHERPDGKGYPRRLTGGEIPDIAKIIAVAEVYDTLTAPDTYRTRLSSFEALTELRRVSGTQLEERYVEALAELLAGQGTEYRHADAADYDEELAIERRMNQAAGG